MKINRSLVSKKSPKIHLQSSGDPTKCLVSMGNYFFKADVLEDALITDALDPESNNDFGHNIIPRLVSEGADVESMIFLRTAFMVIRRMLLPTGEMSVQWILIFRPIWSSDHLLPNLNPLQS